MATDIAFAVGVLTLLGPRVPSALRVLLLALAIIDDIGAILVIALFYSSGIQVGGLFVALGGVLGTLLLQRVGVRQTLVYVLPGIVVWAGMLMAGIHPTIAGVIMGLLTPAKSWFGGQGFLEEARDALDEFSDKKEHVDDAHSLMPPLGRLETARREAVAPVVRLESALHPWVAYGIMPVFALANAGVSVGEVDIAGAESFVIAVGVTLGLALGKPLGVVLLSLAVVKVGLCALPRGVNVRGLLVVGSVAGIGFTMALFIAQLAFTDAGHLGVAKLAILVGSLVAGVLGVVLGRALLPKHAPEGVAATADEAERSTDT